MLQAVAPCRGALYRAMGLLTTASPCALVLVPLAYVSAIAAITSRCCLFRCTRLLATYNCCLSRLHKVEAASSFVRTRARTTACVYAGAC